LKRVVLPWPYYGLWSNHRPHWAQKARATRSYRFAAKALALGADVGEVRVTFCPKSRGPLPDRDNCISAFKAGQDGIADALRVNDRDLTVKHFMGERCKDGAVIVEICPPKVEPIP
jgi:hypothetical protein